MITRPVRRRVARRPGLAGLALVAGLTGLGAASPAAPPVVSPAVPTAAPQATADDPIDLLLRDYIGLYAKDTLDAWRGLFHPAFVAAFTNPDGTTTSRTLDEFVTRQRNYFATGRPIREELRDVKVERQGPLASVRAGFVLYDGDAAKEGRLMILLIRDRDRFLIQSLVFSYGP